MMKSEEAELIAGCLKGDRKAWKALYERYAPQMYGVCLRYARTDAAAEDVLQEGFIKVFESLGRLKKSESLGAWIRQIMVWTAINSYKREHPIASTETATESEPVNEREEAHIMSGMDIEHIRRAINELPTRYRMVFNLCAVEEYGVDEVAEMLGIERVSVRSDLSRARQMLIVKLKQYLKEQQ